MNATLEILDKRQTGEYICTLTVRVTTGNTTYPYELSGVPISSDQMEKYLRENQDSIIQAAINANQAAYSERVAALELVTDMLMDEV